MRGSSAGGGPASPNRTASDSNPYVYIEVDVASLDAHLNNLPGHPAKFNEDGSPRNDYLASSPADCGPASTPSPTPSPTSAPSASPSETSDPMPSPTSTSTPSPSTRPSPTAATAPSVSLVSPDPTPTTAAPIPMPSVPATDTDSSATVRQNEGVAYLLVFAGLVVGSAVLLRDFRRPPPKPQRRRLLKED